MENITEQKRQLREKMLLARLRFPEEAKRETEARVCEQLNRLIDERQARVIHTFLPMGREIDHTPVIERCLEKGITVVTTKTLPKRQLEHRVLHDLKDLENGVFGTKHPRNSEVWHGEYDLIIVPGLAFDREGRRLGYGGGYYDTFLAEHPEAYKVAIAFAFQVISEVPVNDHDRNVDLVVT